MKLDQLSETVTNRLLAVIEKEGRAPWVRPWATEGIGLPSNPVTQKPYRGFNSIWLDVCQLGYTTNLWATFKQFKEAGGHVRKDEKSVPIVRPIEIKKAFQSAAQGEEEAEKLLLFTGYAVFNLDQVEGCEHLRPAPLDLKPVERRPDLEELVSRTGAKVYPDKAQCFYRPATDSVHMVEAEAFLSADHYYATLFHELGHWTGHETRLGRDLKGAFKTHSYAAEELVAELTSAMLCHRFGIDGLDRHQGAYLSNWASLFREDKSAILKAAGPASKAMALIAPEVAA